MSENTIINPQKISSGTWDENVSWEFYLANELPPEELCTAVFCLALHNDNVVLTQTKRGWEMLGGHIEPGETIEQALFREAHEEGGYTPEDYELFGYRKIISKQPVIARGREYPFPTSYIPHFIATSSIPLEAIHGDEGEVLDRGVFMPEEMRGLGAREFFIIEAGLSTKRG